MQTISLEEIILMQLNNRLNDQYDWYELCKNYKLTEEIIEKYQNKWNWYCIFQYQKLSGEFIEIGRAHV